MPLDPGNAFFFAKVVPCFRTVQPSVGMAWFYLSMSWTPPLCSHFHDNSLPMGFLQMFGHLVGSFKTVPTSLKVLYLSDIERWFLR